MANLKDRQKKMFVSNKLITNAILQIKAFVQLLSGRKIISTKFSRGNRNFIE